MNNRGIYIVDIDGTVADLTHRLHYVKNGRKDWKSFFAEVTKDSPITSVINVVEALNKSGYRIVFLSGRSEEAREATEEWIDEYINIFIPPVFMRKERDYRADSIIKPELLEEVKKAYPDEPILGFFDDRKCVVDVWRNMGYKVFHVAEGEF